MSKLRFKDGTELDVIVIYGSSMLFQGYTRQTLEFQLADTYSMDELYLLFNDKSKTETLTIIDDDGNEYIHNDYVVFISQNKQPILINPETPDDPGHTEMRVSITMGQLSYIEKQLEKLLNK